MQALAKTTSFTFVCNYFDKILRNVDDVVVCTKKILQITAVDAVLEFLSLNMCIYDEFYMLHR